MGPQGLSSAPHKRPARPVGGHGEVCQGLGRAGAGPAAPLSRAPEPWSPAALRACGDCPSGTLSPVPLKPKGKEPAVRGLRAGTRADAPLPDSPLPSTGQAGSRAQGVRWRGLGCPRTRTPPHLRSGPGPSTAPGCLAAAPGFPRPGLGRRSLCRGEPQGRSWWTRWAQPPRRAARAGGRRERGSARGDGWSRAGRGEGDLWGQGASLSIWAGEVRGNQYFR